MRSWFLLLLVACSLLLVRVANADFPALNTRRFQPPISAAGSLYLEPTTTPGPGVWNAAAWFVYSLRPNVLRDVNGVPVADLVSHKLGEHGVEERVSLQVQDGRRASFF